MGEGDIEVLDGMLDDGFTLTHMTGYAQPKAEWPAQKPLQLTTDYARRGDTWTTLRTVATTW